jgi:nucleoside-triphosphatase
VARARRSSLMARHPKLLLEGRPAAGKTTVAQRVAELLRAAGRPVSGFVTTEIRSDGRRSGFAVETLEGKRAVLAHVDFPGPPRVGKYGVELEVIDTLAISSLEQPQEDGVVIIDELGKMELASEAFQDAVRALFDTSVSIVATVQAGGHPFTDALKRRPDIQVLQVTRKNRDQLPDELAGKLRE